MAEYSNEYRCTAKVGLPAPAFDMLSTADIESLQSHATLAGYEGKWLVLFFYPMDFTAVCPTEVIALSDRSEEFEEIGAEILGVSTDSVYCHRAWINTPRNQGGVGTLTFPLASDITKRVSRDYGVLSEQEGVALRGLFIIDPTGILQYSVIYNLTIGRSVDETLRVLEGLQTGGLCPADWKPGKQILNV